MIRRPQFQAWSMMTGVQHPIDSLQGIILNLVGYSLLIEFLPRCLLQTPTNLASISCKMHQPTFPNSRSLTHYCLSKLILDKA